jgi:hypothetical protein
MTDRVTDNKIKNYLSLIKADLIASSLKINELRMPEKDNLNFLDKFLLVKLINDAAKLLKPINLSNEIK